MKVSIQTQMEASSRSTHTWHWYLSILHTLRPRTSYHLTLVSLQEKRCPPSGVIIAASQSRLVLAHAVWLRGAECTL